jgi:ribonuclease R
VEAERESTKIAEVQFLKRHVGDVFAGVIGGVMPFGLFVELKRYGIEGLVPVRTMGDDYYIFDERARSLRGRSNRRVFQLGSPVFVRVIRVNEIDAQIDLELIDESEYVEEGGEEELEARGSAEPEVEKSGEEGERFRVARTSRVETLDGSAGGARGRKAAPGRSGTAKKTPRSNEQGGRSRKPNSEQNRERDGRSGRSGTKGKKSGGRKASGGKPTDGRPEAAKARTRRAKR